MKNRMPVENASERIWFWFYYLPYAIGGFNNG
jgi:hypothetical protein